MVAIATRRLLHLVCMLALSSTLAHAAHQAHVRVLVEQSAVVVQLPQGRAHGLEVVLSATDAPLSQLPQPLGSVIADNHLIGKQSISSFVSLACDTTCSANLDWLSSRSLYSRPTKL